VTAGELTLTTFAQDADSDDAGSGRRLKGWWRPERMVPAGRLIACLGRMEDAQDAPRGVFCGCSGISTGSGADPKSWLYRVTVNVCNDHHLPPEGGG